MRTRSMGIAFLGMMAFCITAVSSAGAQAQGRAFAALLYQLCKTTTQKEVALTDITTHLQDRFDLCRAQEQTVWDSTAKQWVATGPLPVSCCAYERAIFSPRDSALMAFGTDSMFTCHCSFELPVITFYKQSAGQARLSIAFEEIEANWLTRGKRVTENFDEPKRITYADLIARWGKPVSITRENGRYMVSFSYHNSSTGKKAVLTVISDAKPSSTANTIHAIILTAY